MPGCARHAVAALGVGWTRRGSQCRREADLAPVTRLFGVARRLGERWTLNGWARPSLYGNLNPQRVADAARLIGELRNLAFSLGSACASGSGRPSHVLRAIGLTDRQARSSIRLGLGRYTGEGELVSACRSIAAAAEAQQSFAA